MSTTNVIHMYSRTILDFHAEPDDDGVLIVISGDDSVTVNIAHDLISSSADLYDALGDLVNDVCRIVGENDERFSGVIQAGKRAIAKSKGAILQSDLAKLRNKKRDE